jgi:trehalose-6-phosphatase/adenine/guanine phosphoribosyltransferase-like PRPP-binding protein
MNLQDLTLAISPTSTERALAVQQPRGDVLPLELLESELNFYASYPWSLNIFPTVKEIRGYLQGELARLEVVTEDWQRNEVATNIFLLSCALTQTVDDYLLGKRYDFTKAVATAPMLARVVPTVELGLRLGQRVRELSLNRLHDWRQRWDAGVIEFTQVLLADGPIGQKAFASCTSLLASLLAQRLRFDLIGRRSRVPSAFHSQSLTHIDALTLARKFVDSFTDRSRPILILGLRTAGSYFGPVVCAHLKSEGYQQVDCVTVRPTTGISSWEAQEMTRCAAKGALAVIVDEPMTSGNAVAQAVRFLHQAGFETRDIVALVPNHPARRGWTWPSSARLSPAPQITIVLLDGAEWHKRQLLKPMAVESHLREYFLRRGYRSAVLGSSPRLEELLDKLKDLCVEKGHIRLKGIYEVHLQDADGKTETRYVLAKSAGWGWLGYHTFLEAHRLSLHIPPVLGLRDGILYSEWLPQGQQAATDFRNRDQLVGTLGSYVAARVRSLSLGVDPSADLNKEGRNGGLRLLADALSQAYRDKVTAALKRTRLRERLARSGSPCLTLIDGKMQPVEWIHGPTGLLKTDFDHHGLGKPQLNVTDPAYDLAEAILCWDLSPTEESTLLACYVDNCGDAGVHQRLILYKILAGTLGTQSALEGLGLPHLSRHHAEFHRRYVQARKFLTSHTRRFCSGFCLRPKAVSWRSPLVVLDIDGVLDAWVFGFASTTKAGIQAVSLLHTHDFAVAVDTARSMAEVQEYCKAYGFVGGVAEYGSALWDAVQNRELVLVSSESLSELEKVKRALREVPGVFLDDGYRYSIRAYCFQDERTLPVPTPIIQNLLTKLATTRLRIRQTLSDTAILTQGIDKGTGLQSLLSWVGAPELDTIAIGDSEADLEMFRVAKRSFSPAQTKCREAAQLLGCRIADRSYQAGLLRIVQSLIHPQGERCKRCRSVERHWPKSKDVLLELLELADKSGRSSLLKAIIDPKGLGAFVK